VNLFAPAAAMIEWPWIAAVIGVGFTALFMRRRNRATAWAAALWVAYAAYEYGMKARVLCSGECNIRVDLLLIWPVLFVVGAAGLWRALRPPAPRAK
jgi:hypothetical protein